jgi:hypothetical protein
MSILSRFFGKKEADDSKSGLLVANSEIKNPLSLQLLFADRYRLEPDLVTAALESYHRSMSGARFELEPALAAAGKTVGMLGWGKHVIRFLGFDLPMPSAAIETCLAPSHYGQDLKERARAHKSHLLLFYVGYEPSLHEQFVALAATAGVLANFGALVVLNEAGHTSFPAVALSKPDADCDTMELLREFPIPTLYCGFVKCEVQGIPGVWMRTYGAGRLMLPDFASHAAGHHEGQRYFDLFNSIFRYLFSSGKQLAAGHTMQVGQNEFLRLRTPDPSEAFLESDGELFVAELIGADEINP